MTNQTLDLTTPARKVPNTPAIEFGGRYTRTLWVNPGVFIMLADYRVDDPEYTCISFNLSAHNMINDPEVVRLMLERLQSLINQAVEQIAEPEEERQVIEIPVPISKL